MCLALGNLPLENRRSDTLFCLMLKIELDAAPEPSMTIPLKHQAPLVIHSDGMEPFLLSWRFNSSESFLASRLHSL